jgi:hypothetical protein
MPDRKFTEADYNSNNGMLTSIWGPALWHTLHTMSFNYPVKPTKEQKEHYRTFIMALTNVIPCGICRKNLVKNLADVPLTDYALCNRKNFSRWMFRLHEHINTMLNKKSGLSYEDVAFRYENFRARCAQSGSKDKVTVKGKEDGCVVPVTGIQSKCIISIVPKETNCASFTMDKKCYHK